MKAVPTLLFVISFALTGFGGGGAAHASARQDLVTASPDSVANRLIDAALADSSAFERLAYLVDTFGPRFSGTRDLERALDWILETMEADGLENVHGEEVMVPRWVRGIETLTMTSPRRQQMQLLGLGGSVGTAPSGIEGEVLVVGSFDELTEREAEAAGKIVLFDVPFTSYGETVRYRTHGATRASEAGAIASLIRSVGPVSLYTPHTGAMRYQDGVRRIPHAAITAEDAAMMHRMQDRGQRVRVSLRMDARTEADVPSRNVVAEIVGWEHPEEVVIMGGHIDSWDVGQGAMDDGGGCVAAWQALLLMKKLGLRPRRTVRVVLWTNEENGLRGGTGYRDAHMDEIDNMVLAIETDSGVFKPLGFGFGGSDAAFADVQRVGRLLDRIGAGEVVRGGGGADIGPLMREGVPGMGLRVDGSKYFWYHHTNADTIDKLDPHEMNLCIAALAVMAYGVADLPERIGSRSTVTH